MNDNQYAKRAVILAITSFFLANSAFIVPFLELFSESILKIKLHRYFFFGILWVLCLFASLPMAIIAYRMGSRMKGSIAQLNITRIVSLLAISASSFWIIMFFIGPIIARSRPGG